MSILFFKALHIVGFVSWFAGVFYLVRLFVYHKEALDEGNTKMTQQYHIMESRLFYIITQPAMVITWIAGLAMLYIYGWEWFKLNLWMHYKLLLLLLLTVYNFWMQRTIKRLKNGFVQTSSFQYRLLNEVPTLLLIAIVFLAVYRSAFSLLYGIGALLTLGVVLFVAAKLYAKARKRE